MKKDNSLDKQYETDIYTLLNECAKDRLKEQERLRHDINHIAKLEYSLFCAWCNAFKNAQYNEQNFKEYARTEKELSFWVKKKIAEMFFDYIYEFDHDTNKWHCKKLKIA